MELQIVAATMAENPGKQLPEEALAKFPRLAAQLAALYAGFDAMSVNEEFAAHEAEESGLADEDEEVEASVLAVARVEFDDTFDEE